MERGSDSVSLVVEEEKHAMSVSIQTSHSWAVPGPLRLPCRVQRDEWPTACSWHPGEQQHPPLSRLSPQERTPRVEAFPALFLETAVLPKPVEWLPVASQQCRADTVANTVVFLPAVLHGGTGKHDSVVQVLERVYYISGKMSNILAS
jgi:hypothetical protein